MGCNVTVTYYSVISVTGLIYIRPLQLHHERKEGLCNVSVTNNSLSHTKDCNGFVTLQ